MAKYNEILVGRFNRALQKLMGMKGGPPAGQLSGDIQANVQFNAMGQDFRALEDWYRFGIFMQLGGSAAVQNQIRMRNPAGSNRIIVFEKISVTNSVATASAFDLETQTTNTDLGTIIPSTSNLSWDKRKNVGSGLIMSQAINAAALSLIRQEILVQGTQGFFNFIGRDNEEIILSPGEAIQVRQQTVNQQLSVTWWWRERFFEESEATA
jgi:hypothetical protein